MQICALRKTGYVLLLACRTQAPRAAIDGGNDLWSCLKGWIVSSLSRRAGSARGSRVPATPIRAGELATGVEKYPFVGGVLLGGRALWLRIRNSWRSRRYSPADLRDVGRRNPMKTRKPKHSPILITFLFLFSVNLADMLLYHFFQLRKDALFPVFLDGGNGK